MVNPTIKWVIIACCELCGIYCLIYAYRNPNFRKYKFKLSHLFQNIPLGKSSITQTVIEGVSIMLAGVLCYFFL